MRTRQGSLGSSGEDSEETDAGPARSLRNGSPKRLVKMVMFAAVVVLVVVALVLAWVAELATPSKATARLTVPPGGSLYQMAPAMAREGVVANAALFRLWLRLMPPGPIQPGLYVLHRNESFAAAVAGFEGGPRVIRVTIPPGFTLDQIAAAVAAKMPGHSASQFLAVAKGGSIRSPYEPAGTSSLEGLLYPATYAFSPNATDAQIISAMVSRFNAEASSLQLAARARSMGFSPYQMVVVASMVEREAKLAADRPRVARVIYNRLADNMALQIDATEAYALGNPAGGITRAELQSPSPYNTYLNKGLPPTPIASPSRASLVAAMFPSPGPWLYYVVVSASGREAFSSTYAGQQANVALARQRGLR